MTGRSTVAEQCRQLLAQRGDVSNQALAMAIIDALEKAGASEREKLIAMLATEFSPDPIRVAEAAITWLTDPDAYNLGRLADAVEPPRQELFRRLNAVPGGTIALVQLRADALALARSSPGIEAVARDLRHLFSSWFNHGFLQLEEITWKTPADILERVSTSESVHELNGWKDLRNRLAADRRCFALFHPALPREPLAFVAVALTDSLPAAAATLIRRDRHTLDPASADSAIFYSINTVQTGLRGVSFGAFLIKQAMSELARNLPGLVTFATLSPMRQFATALGNVGEFTDERLRGLLGRPAAEEIRGRLNSGSRAPENLADSLRTLGLAYLSQVKVGRRAADPVAHFHLANGARIERVNSDADTIEHVGESCGLMVNYRYIPAALDSNRESYIEHGRVAVAPALEPELAKVNAAWVGG